MPQKTDETSDRPGTTDRARPEPRPRILDSAELMDGDRELIILHRSDRYRLRITANDKLILTK